MEEQYWYKDAIFYEVYVRAFRDSNGDGHGDLHGLMEKLDYLKELGVDCLWLLPIYPSPLVDDGYDISNHYDVHPDYGSLDDFKTLLKEAHSRGIRIIMDLVLNHTSDKHPWFQAARTSRNSPFRDYYVWSDTDDKYRDARIIFLDTEPSNWTWDEEAGQYYWHRFYAAQPDLNYDNPTVQEEILKIISFWLDLGVDGFRADAVPYLIEREGTNCENLPETHAFLKRLRHFIDEHYPGRILLAEANQWPEDVIRYFGDGTDEFHIGFHFPVMPRIFMSLRKQDSAPLAWAMEHTPKIFEGCQWCIFLRNHDELTLEMVTPDERDWMWQEYAPDPRMRLNLGIRRRLTPLLENDRRLVALANSLLFTLPGSPIIYYGDEIGMGDNIWLPDRNGVRTPMQWSSSAGAGFSAKTNTDLYAHIISEDPYGPQNVNVEQAKKDPDSIWNSIRKMITVRKSHPVFGRGDFAWIPCDNPAIAAYERSYKGQKIWVVQNLSDLEQNIFLDLPGGDKTDLLKQKITPSPGNDGLKLSLQPYEYLWLVERKTSG